MFWRVPSFAESGISGGNSSGVLLRSQHRLVDGELRDGHVHLKGGVAQIDGHIKGTGKRMRSDDMVVSRLRKRAAAKCQNRQQRVAEAMSYGRPSWPGRRRQYRGGCPDEGGGARGGVGHPVRQAASSTTDAKRGILYGLTRISLVI